MANESVRERAGEYWLGGDPLKAGELIFESLHADDRPGWAAGILRLVLERTKVRSPAIDHILYVADRARKWKGAHAAFSAARREVLILDKLARLGGLAEDQKTRLHVLALAELVAKVTYNAIDPPDEFDEDSGWWIARCLRGFVNPRDQAFAEAAWAALCSHIT